MNHELKTWPEFFSALVSGEKTAEIRKDDRPFAVGDILWLREWCPKINRYTGHEARFKVLSVLRKCIGLKRGSCLIGIKQADSGILTHFNAAAAGKKR